MDGPFKFSATTRVGFSDTDAQGIVYYGRYNPYFDLARVEYHRALGLLRRDQPQDARERDAPDGDTPHGDTPHGDTRHGDAPDGEARPGDFVMRANDVEYFAPARFDDQLEIHCRVSRIGRTSVTFEFAAHRLPDDTLMVTAHQTLVYIDLGERRATEVPADYRAAVKRHEGDDVDG